jgi:hypothetical protein
MAQVQKRNRNLYQTKNKNKNNHLLTCPIRNLNPTPTRVDWANAANQLSSKAIISNNQDKLSKNNRKN